MRNKATVKNSWDKLALPGRQAGTQESQPSNESMSDKKEYGKRYAAQKIKTKNIWPYINNLLAFDLSPGQLFSFPLVESFAFECMCLCVYSYGYGTYTYMCMRLYVNAVMPFVLLAYPPDRIRRIDACVMYPEKSNQTV